VGKEGRKTLLYIVVPACSDEKTHNSNMPEQDKHSNTKQLVLAMCIPSKLSGNECAL
jgi:hypothetical protein